MGQPSRFLRCDPAGFDIGSDRSDWGDGFDESTVHFIKIKSCSPRVIEGGAADAPFRSFVDATNSAADDGMRTFGSRDKWVRDYSDFKAI